MADQLLGREVNASLQEKIKAQVALLGQQGITPGLCIIRVGEKESDISYERGAIKRCQSLGLACTTLALPEDVSQEELLQVIGRVNEDEKIHGVLMLRPLPRHLDEEKIANALLPEKDVDGMTDLSMAGVFGGKGLGFAPCTAEACLEILDHYQIPVEGRRCTVIGRSLVIGRPVAMLLMAKNGTVTICHTRTRDMQELARQADILIVAAGRPRIIGADYCREGQVVIDVGIHVDENGKLCGDVDTEAVSGLVEAITPVPGGVGAVTTTVLAAHVVQAAAKRARI